MVDPLFKVLVPLVFGLGGLAALIGGCVWGFQQYMLYRDGAHAEGVVVANLEGLARNIENEREITSVSYYPVIEFHVNGQKYQFRGGTGSNVPEFEVGEPVDVIYSTRNPLVAQINNFSHIWLGPMVLSVMGFAFVTTALIVGFSGGTPEIVEQRQRFQHRLERVNSVRIVGTVSEVRKIGDVDGEVVLVVSAVRPGKFYAEDFVSKTFVMECNQRGSLRARAQTDTTVTDRCRALVGREVEVMVDSDNHANYEVKIIPVVRDVMQEEAG